MSRRRAVRSALRSLARLDAGVFMLKFAEYVAEGRAITSFSQSDVPFFRMEIAYTLFQTRLGATTAAAAGGGTI